MGDTISSFAKSRKVLCRLSLTEAWTFLWWPCPPKSIFPVASASRVALPVLKGATKALSAKLALQKQREGSHNLLRDSDIECDPYHSVSPRFEVVFSHGHLACIDAIGCGFGRWENG
jgi:hypothetical protein